MRRRSTPDSFLKNRGIPEKRKIRMLEHPFCFLSFISCTYLLFFYSPDQGRDNGKNEWGEGTFTPQKSLNSILEVAGLLQKKFSALSVALLQKKLQKKYTFSLYRLIVIHM
jgi:hypothetical protein